LPSRPNRQKQKRRDGAVAAWVKNDQRCGPPLPPPDWPGCDVPPDAPDCDAAPRDGLDCDAPGEKLDCGADWTGEELRGEFMTGLLLPPLDRGLEYSCTGAADGCVTAGELKCWTGATFCAGACTSVAPLDVAAECEPPQLDPGLLPHPPDDAAGGLCPAGAPTDGWLLPGWFTGCAGELTG
jgi:hypothetical protein